MTIETLPFERRPRNCIANNLDKINELVDWANQDSYLWASASGERVTVDDASSIKGLTVDGRSVQDGTPTPDAPVPVQVVEGGNLQSWPTSGTYSSGGASIAYGPNGDTITVASSTTANVWGLSDSERLNNLVHLMPGTYVITCPDNLRLMVLSYDGGTGTWTNIASNTRSPYTLILQEASDIICMYSILNGTSAGTYEGWVQLEAGTTATPYVPYGSIGIVVGDTATQINLQGNTLASLPDGTRDELHVDSTGHCVLTKNVGKYVITGQENGSTSPLGDYYRFYSSAIENMQAPLQVTQGDTNGYCTYSQYEVNYTGQYVHAYVVQTRRFLVFSTNAAPLNEYVGAELYYPLATPQTVDLGYIDPPAIPSGSVVTISASLTPTFTLEWWVDSGITDVIEDLKAYVDYRIGG